MIRDWRENLRKLIIFSVGDNYSEQLKFKDIVLRLCLYIIEHAKINFYFSLYILSDFK
jgi:hypothetical protein